MSRRAIPVIVVLAVAGALSLSLAASSTRPAQQSPRQQVVPQLEVFDQPYIPVPPEQQLTSPGFNGARGGYVSVQVNVNANGQNILGDAANEPSLAVDPTNRQRIVIGWRQFDTVNSNFRQAGWAYTANGGQTWRFPGVIHPGLAQSDPVLDVDALGNFYYDTITVNGFQATVYKSTNGGVSWDSGHSAWGGDKEWMVIDRTGGVGNGNIYSYWTPWYSVCNGQFTRSTNGGQSFEACTNIDGQVHWGTMAVGPDGTLYVASDGMAVAKSTNAKIAGQTPTWTVQSVDLGGSLNYGEGPNPGGLLGQAWVATDRSNNPSRGNVYLLASVAPGGTGPVQVKFSRSTNGGQTWSPAVRVNDDANPANNWHWFGTMSVAPNGRIDAVWNDTRDHPGTYLSELFYSYSENAGQTWSPNVAVSLAFDPYLGWPQQSKIGDYIGSVSFNAGAHVAYSATFNGEQDVYYLYIPRYAKGDINCDGAINFGDIDAFVLALSNPAAYAAAYPNCDIMLADVNGDGTVDFSDIDPFVALLSG